MERAGFLESEHARLLVVLLLCLTVAPSLLGVASADGILGQARYFSLVYSVSYQGSLQPGSSITFLNTLYFNGSGTGLRITSIHIFTDFGNHTDPGPFPFYLLTTYTRTLASPMTVQIPESVALGNHQAVAVATFQVESITVNGEVWLDEKPLVIQGTLLILSPLGIALSMVLTGLAKYWPPILTIYLTTVAMLTYLVAESDRKKQDVIRTSTSLTPENPANKSR